MVTAPPIKVGLITMNLLLYLCLLTCVFALDPAEVDGKKLYPSLRTFANKLALMDSYLWTYFTRATYDVLVMTTALYIEDTKTILVLLEPKTRDLVSAGKQFLGVSTKKIVSMTEIDLGSELFSVGSDFFPLVTVSAQYSTGMATVEREVTQSYSVSFNPSLNRAFGLVVVSLKAVLGVTIGLEMAEREVITCLANPGGRVQLQVSNRMLHFPKARTRSIKFYIRDKTFVGSTWERVRSAVADEEHMGALFYENFKLGKHRCVTKVTRFHDAAARKWVEWAQPYKP